MNTYADILMVMHLVWVLFMVLGLPLGLWLGSPVLRWAHFTGMAITAFIAAAGFYCPLTIWEEALRLKTDPGFTFDGSFLARFLSEVLYPQVSPTAIRFASVAWGLITVILMFLIPPGAHRPRDTTEEPEA